MSDGIISGAGRSLYEPWQFASFDPPSQRGLPTAADLERVQQQARNEGQAAGYAEGRKRAEAEAQRLRSVLTAVQGELAGLDQTIGEHLLTLALDIARRVAGEALKAKPELIVSIVQEAVRCLPEFEQPVRVLLHPDDAELVQSHLGAHAAASGWIIVPDAKVQRGGCRLKTASTEIDASVSGRWERVLAALGQDHEWVAP